MTEDERTPDSASVARERRLDVMRQMAREQLDASEPLSPGLSQSLQDDVGARDGEGPRWWTRRPLVTAVIVIALVAVLAGVVARSRLIAPASGGAKPAPRDAALAFQDFVIPTANGKPLDIALGPDGALWFTEFDGDKIGRIAPSGAITEYPVPTPGVGPYMIVAGPDRALWFTEYYGNKIGRVALDGAITEYTLSDPNSSATGITAGPDGALWVAAYPADIYRVAPNGSMTRFPLLSPSPVPFAIAAGSDGALWFTYDAEFASQDPEDASKLGRISPSGAVSQFSPPAAGGNIDGIAAGPDGALWFTDYANDLIGSISPNGVIHEYPANSPYNALNAIAAGPDGALWYTRQDGLIGRITPAGTISTFTVPTSDSQPDGIVAGPGKTIWFTELGANRIGRITLP